MTDKDRDRKSRAGSTRLCIVSRDRLRCGEFVECLRESLDPDDEIEIILDRRQRRPATEAERGAMSHSLKDRRRHPQVDSALRLHGFAIVPVPVTGSLKIGRPHARYAPDPSIVRLFSKDMDERDGLEDILEFEGRRARLRPWLILGGLAGAILGVLLLLPAIQARLNRLRPATPPVAEQTEEPPLVAAPPVAQAPPVAETPTPDREATVAPPAAAPERQDLEQPPEASAPPIADPEPPRAAGGPREARSAGPKVERRRETPTLPKPAPGPVASAPAATRVPSRGPSESKIIPPRFAGLPQVEVTRNPSRAGLGDEYAVRISDTAGRPIAGAEVMLLGRLVDGTTLDIPLDSGPEPGTYHGTVPSGSAGPVDLRIRVVTSDKRAEIPVRP